MTPQTEIYHLTDPKFPGRRIQDLRRYFTKAGFPDYSTIATSMGRGIDYQFGGREDVSGYIGYSEETGKIVLSINLAKGRTKAQQDVVTELLLSFHLFNPKSVKPKKLVKVQN